MTYNLTGIVSNSSTGILGLTQGVNDTLMFGWLGAMFLIGVCVFAFMTFVSTTQDTSKSMAATAFIAFTLSLLFRAINLIGDKFMYITLILAAVAIAFSYKRE